MDLDEALKELGLDPATDPDQASIRRAYLKGVKQRKPETDPEGFRRLREAYDLLRGVGPVMVFASESAAAPLEIDDDERSVAAPPEPAPALPDSFSMAADHLTQDQPELAVDVIVAGLPKEHSDQYWHLYHQALRFVLGLHKRDLVGPAGRLFAAIKTSLGGKGPQAGPLSLQLGLLYLVCSELDGMPDLPITFRQGVALVVLHDDPGASYNTVRDYERAHGSRPTRRLRNVLRQRAPTMASLFTWSFEPQVVQGIRLSMVALFSGLLIVIVVLWIRNLRPAPQREPPSSPIPDGMSLLVFCEGTGAEGVSLCLWVQMLDEALRKSQCPQARGYLDGLQQDASVYAPRVRAEVGQLAARVERQCRR